MELSSYLTLICAADWIRCIHQRISSWYPSNGQLQKCYAETGRQRTRKVCTTKDAIIHYSISSDYPRTSLLLEMGGQAKYYLHKVKASYRYM